MKIIIMIIMEDFFKNKIYFELFKEFLLFFFYLKKLDYFTTL
jgi:hypothetical protein